MVEERLEGRIGDDVGDGQRHDGDDTDGDEQAGAERHGQSWRRLAKGVADQADGVDDRRAGHLELLAQVADVGLDDVAVAPEVVVPDVVEDLGLGQDVAGVEQEEAEQVELGGGQGDDLAGPGHLVGVLVHLDVGETQDPAVLVLGSHPTQDGVHPGHDLGEGERLGHVVVAADGEAGHLVLDGVAGGEEQDRDPDAASDGAGG